MAIIDRDVFPAHLETIETQRGAHPQELSQAGIAALRPPLAQLALAGSAASAETSYDPESAQTDHSHEVFRILWNAETYEAEVESDLTEADYQSITRPEDWALLQELTAELEGKTVVFFNPTKQGGGVAMLRPAIVHLLRLRGVDAHWYVMKGADENEPDPFLFTKDMHNIIQRRSSKRISENPAGKTVHQAWNAQNAAVFTRQAPIVNADIIVVDDPQPAPLTPYLKQVNPHAKYIWRNHIDNDGELMADPTTPQGEVASYLLDECGIRDFDAAIYHPVERFVHPDLWHKAYFAPATIELFDDLNRELTEQEIRAGLDFINGEITAKNTELDPEDRVASIDPHRRRLALVARFDESKGMDKAMALGVRTRQMMRAAGVPETELPQVIIIGNGSVDDPSGPKMYDEMLRLRRERYPEEKDDIILMRLKHNYQAMNASMYVASGYGELDVPPLVAMQTSDAEGCETRISDWIRHGIPVVIANRGGMPLQVKEGESGYIMDYDEPGYGIEDGARYVAELMTNPVLYAKVRRLTNQQAETFINREFVTVANTLRFARIFYNVLQGLPADKLWKLGDLHGSQLQL